MRKILLAGLLLATSSAFAQVKFSPNIKPGLSVGLTGNGDHVYLAGIEESLEDGRLGFSAPDQFYSDILSKEDLESILSKNMDPEEVSFLLSKFPEPPVDSTEFYDGITTEEFHAILDHYVTASVLENNIDLSIYGIEQQTIGNNIIPVSANQDRLVFIEFTENGNSESMIYSCDSDAWDRNISALDNFQYCLKSSYYYDGYFDFLSFIGSAFLRINDSSLSIFQKKLSANEVTVLDPVNGFYDFTIDGIDLTDRLKSVYFSSGPQPFILYYGVDNEKYKDDEAFKYIYQYTGGSLKKYQPNYTDSLKEIPGTILDLVGEKLIYTKYYNDKVNVGVCEVDFIDNSNYDFGQFVREYALSVRNEGQEGELIHQLFITYPNTPENIDYLVEVLDLSEYLNINEDVENNYIEFVELHLMQHFQDQGKKEDEVECVANTQKELYSGLAGLVTSSSDKNGNYYVTIRQGANQIPFDTITISSVTGKSYTYMHEVVKYYKDVFPGLIENAMYLVEVDYPGLLDNYPDLPDDLSLYSSIDGLNEDSYLTLSSYKILSEAFIQPLGFYTSIDFSVVGSKVLGGFGIVDYNFTPSREVEVRAEPSSLLIDPYMNAVSSIDIITDGELFAADVACSIDGPLDITSADYSSWGGSERLTLPLQWTSKDAKGVVSLKGDVDSVSGEQQLLVLDTLAELTTADVTVNCEATVSDKNGNQLNVNLVPATIRLDDGIHGGSGVITGQVTLPAGVSAEDVTVEVTINGRTINVEVDENGRFEFDELRDGDFTVNVKSERYTQSCINTTTSGNTIDLGNIELIAGDVNNDGEINIADFTYLSGRYGAIKGDDNYSALADLNSDDEINIQDLAILGNHFGSRQCNP